MFLYAEQVLNGLQLGVMLFLMSAGLTLVFGAGAVADAGGKVEDKNAMRAALRKASFQSVRGPFRFNRNHFPIQNYYLNEVAKDPSGKLYNKLLGVAIRDSQNVFHGACPMKW